MNRISKTQFYSLLLINDVFVLFCISGSISLVTAAGFAAGTLIQFIISIPIIQIYRNGRELKECGKTAGIIVLLGVLMWGGALFSMLRRTGEIVFVPFKGAGIWGQLIVTVIIALVCVYISSSGIKALARSAVIAAALGAICLAVVAVSAAINSDIENLHTADSNGFFRELVKGIALSGGMISFIVLAGFVRGNVRGAAYGYFGVKAVVTSFVLIVGVLVSGGIMKITDFPIVTAAQLSQPFPVQRIDSLFLIVFTVFAVYSIAVQASAAEFVLTETIPFIKKYRCSLMLLIMAAAGYLTGGKNFYGITAAIIPVFIILAVPGIYHMKRLLKGGQGR